MNMYHSALKTEKYQLKKMKSTIYNGNEAFSLDLVNEIERALELNDYDIIYSEPAWKFGYDEFLERADKENSNYNEYVNAMIKIIENNKPIVLILGKHIINKFPKSQSKISLKLNGYKTFAYGWNIDITKYEPCNKNYDLIEKLSFDYKKVWDFSCGYGNTGKIFIDNNKNCMLTDINEKCIAYIHENIFHGGRIK